MAFSVLLTEHAESDLEQIYRFVADADSIDHAERVLRALEAAISRLSNLPQRGNTPKELQGLRMTDYREIHWKPYRIIYRIADRRVIVHCIADGRRDMQSLLQRRLLS